MILATWLCVNGWTQYFSTICAFPAPMQAFYPAGGLRIKRLIV
jgi:hypothetical protein